MRSALGKTVRKQFEEQVHRHLPSFEPDPTAVVPQGWRVFRWRVRPDLTCYLVLCISPKQDRFTIECAWSRTNTFPAYGGLQNPRAWPEHEIRQDQPRGGQFSFRLCHLWQPEDHWWWLVPESQVKAQMERFTDAVIAQDVSSVLRAMEDPALKEALANVQPMVEDAVRRIISHALPYFETIIDSESEENASS